MVAPESTLTQKAYRASKAVKGGPSSPGPLRSGWFSYQGSPFTIGLAGSSARYAAGTSATSA